MGEAVLWVQVQKPCCALPGTPGGTGSLDAPTFTGAHPKATYRRAYGMGLVWQGRKPPCNPHYQRETPAHYASHACTLHTHRAPDVST